MYRQSLEGNNYSVQSIKAYLGDLAQFIQWLQTRRVDFDIPHRIERIDIVQFINYLAERKASAITRKRKLAAIRGFLKFCKDNQIIFGNPADTIEGPIREERDPSILLKTEYKALLQVAGGNTRDLAIVMLFLQTGLRVSELVNLKLSDIDFTSHEITVRQGKGRKDRVVPLVKQAEQALMAYLKVRDAQPEYDEVLGVSHLLHTKSPSDLRAFLDKLGNIKGEVLDRLIDLNVMLSGGGRPDTVVAFLQPSQPPHPCLRVGATPVLAHALFP